MRVVVPAFLAFFLLPAIAIADALRIDGSSDKAADESFGAMVNAESGEERQKLLIALVEINVAGMPGLGEAEASEASHHPSAARVREKIGGMTAEEIIALGDRVHAGSPDLRVVMHDHGSSSSSGPRIDGSSDQTADASFGAMVDKATPGQREQLVVALVQINMQGIKSARDAMFEPSAARVRAVIDGMTAEDIIAAGQRVQDASGGTQVKIKNRDEHDPGVPSELLKPLPAGKPHPELAGTTWAFDERANGTVQHYVYTLNADGTATMIETDLKPGGVTRWEASGNAFRLSINDGYSVMLGTFDGDGALHGDGGNRRAFRYTWTATKR